MTERVHQNPNLIFSEGTQVVSLREIVGQNGRTLHPRGAVGVIVRSPGDLDHAYRVRFLDGVEEALRGARGGHEHTSAASVEEQPRADLEREQAERLDRRRMGGRDLLRRARLAAEAARPVRELISEAGEGEANAVRVERVTRGPTALDVGLDLLDPVLAIVSAPTVEGVDRRARCLLDGVTVQGGLPIWHPAKGHDCQHGIHSVAVARAALVPDAHQST